MRVHFTYSDNYDKETHTSFIDLDGNPTNILAATKAQVFNRWKDRSYKTGLINSIEILYTE